ncbi:energy transducer TonB [Flavobacterium sharifuzzamanii]|uniref:energy transducer TonB n=1 Tax=Flavobacterium sharifuzzamanii TaxID=2211133 RepID=UPI000DAB8828|nr:energy transducer TonB [Flavobacterium sharifuzzamanii]KAF2079617.1 hypothetical protein DMA14_18920 [Flavobacterium sharifuzzamanii]
MERNHKITIPEPCHEDWDKMTPVENGRFCLSCSKTVMDFTSMLPEEIQYYFIQNQNNKICGRFRNSQLESIIIQIPSRTLYNQTSYHKMFLLALFIAMGTTLFSCADKEGNKKKIDQIEIVDNNTQSPDEDVSSCYGHQIESKKKKTKIERERVTMGMVVPAKPIEYYSFKYSIIYNTVDLDILPAPKGGMKKFYSYFANNYTASKKGEMSVLFVVERDGTLTNFKVTKNTSSENEAEVIKVLESGPKWIAGKTNNQSVRSTFILPITFK